jgi:putative membrane protein
MLNSIYDKTKEWENVAIVIIWLFQISAILGIISGFQEWFITKTPLNLLIFLLLTISLFPIRTTKSFLALGLFFFLGIFVEWCGVNYGLFFGNYWYGDNLGIKFQGVPLLIGVNWAILVFITACMGQAILKSWISIFIGALLMVLLDLFMELPAHEFDFWHWEQGHPPLQNFIAWFIVALIMHTIYFILKIKGNLRLSIHLFFAQLFFFILCYGYFKA